MEVDHHISSVIFLLLATDVRETIPVHKQLEHLMKIVPHHDHDTPLDSNL